jgi:dipeptidyl-peptidase-4
MRRLLSFAFLAFAGACIHAKSMTPTWPALDAKLLADSAATYNFRLGLPVPLAVTPDGAVLFRRTPPRAFAADLFELDTKSGAVKTLATADELLGGSGDEHLSNEERARRERARTATRGVVDVEVSSDGHTVFVPLGGMFHLIDRQTGVRRAIDPKGDAYDPHISPDGTQIAFVRDGDLWIIGATGAARRVTKHPEGLEYGVAEFVAQEELDRRRGFWWSPDGKELLFQRTDARKVETVYVADARHPTTPPVPFKYPRAGTPNAIVDLGVVAASGGEPTWLTWDLDKYPYLGRVDWPAKGPLTIVVLSRPQTDLAVIEPRNNNKVLLTEHDDAWLNLGGSGVGRGAAIGATRGSPLWLPDGTFLWTTESRGAWTLEQRSTDGALMKPITTPDFGLEELVGVDGNFAITIASSDPTRADVWLVPLDGSAAPSRLTDGDGMSTAMFDRGVTIVTTLKGSGGRKITANGRELPSVAERPALIATTTLEAVEVGGRTHHVAVTRPRAFDRTKRYPVLLKVYGGPHAQLVTDALDDYVMDQWYADAGFIVVRSDGRGTPHRGRAWERAIKDDLITIPLADQVGALQAIGKQHPEMDLARVGVFGWSFGGYFTTMALLLRPDVFACGVAGAPVTDWSLYDTAYTERYMRTPQDNAKGYAATSALEHAAKLTRPLLLIHGITDDNVHLANTLGLIENLYVAGKRAEVVLLSGTHMVPDPKLALAREQVQVDFFREHLGPAQ